MPLFTVQRAWCRFQKGSEERYEPHMDSSAREQSRGAWRSWLGWLLFVFGVAERVVGWGGSIDFLLARSEDPGWVGEVLKAIQSALPFLGLLSLILGVALLIWNERRRGDQKLDARIASLQPTPLPAPQKQNDSQDVVLDGGTFNEPPKDFAASLYVAEANISVNHLDDEHWLEIAFRVFNATGVPLSVLSVSGSIEAAVQVGNSLPDDGCPSSEHLAQTAA